MFIDFVNSEWYDGRGNLDDLLTDPAWLAAFLERWDLKEYSRIGPEGLADLNELRATLRSIIDTISRDRTIRPVDLASLNQKLAAHPLRFHLGGDGKRFELDVAPASGAGSSIPAGEIALSAARFLAHGERERLKACDNPGCRWVFYDQSKNRSRRWCGGTCGNVDKVRRFRERHRPRSKR
jgi:predicted RNA-binding Zn ribbon-like protein